MLFGVKSRKIKRSMVVAILAVLSFAVSGCATGPLRYKTLGRYEYATVEFTERSPVFLKPVAAVGGVLVDVVLIVGDTLVIPVASAPIAVKTAVVGPCPEARDFKNHPVKETVLSTLLFPLYLPWSYCLNLYFQSYEPKGTPYFDYFYPGLYGDESALYVADPVTRAE
ncbi:MAG: hypothetical protein PF904_10165 [Kiritimatiellae bacterium]|jgi:hypothetical protein|nr:hypothetical protein [Kiritimatiellia bacterium]